MADGDGAGTKPGWGVGLGSGLMAVLVRGLPRVGCPGLWGGAQVWGVLSPGVGCVHLVLCPVPFPCLWAAAPSLSDGQMKDWDLALGVRVGRRRWTVG